MINKMTEYEYRKLRSVVKTAKVGNAVKNLLFCTLRDYKKGASIPEIETFGALDVPKTRVEPRCLVGAAIHDKAIYKKLNTFEQDMDLNVCTWEHAAKLAFGTTEKQTNAIITGFDSASDEVNRNSRIQVLAHKLGVALGAKAETTYSYDDDEDDDEYDDY